MKFREIAVNYASSTQANAFGLCHDLFRFPQPANLQASFEDVLNQLGKTEDLAKLKESQRKHQEAKQKEAA